MNPSLGALDVKSVQLLNVFSKKYVALLEDEADVLLHKCLFILESKGFKAHGATLPPPLITTVKMSVTRVQNDQVP